MHITLYFDSDSIFHKTKQTFALKIEIDANELAWFFCCCCCLFFSPKLEYMYKVLAIINVELGLRIRNRPNSPVTSKVCRDSQAFYK